MSLLLTLDRTSDRAIYRQIAEQIKDQIAAGRLPPGSQLPTVRQLADDLGVTRLTVQNAYAELQSSSWIEATVGRGTFVSDNARSGRRIAERNAPLTADVVIEDMLAIGHVEGMRSLANASPDARLFPADEFWGVLANLRENAFAMAEYGSTQGDPDLRIELAALVRQRGVIAMPDDVLVTTGATQALSLVTQALCRPGDAVLVEQPTYLSFLNILKSLGAQATGVEMDEDGPKLDALERLAVQVRPRFFYTIPTFQNPTGRCMTPTRRRQVLELAERLGFMVVEDDLYAAMTFDAPPPSALKADDHSDGVVYVSSFSKTFMPGMRLGYVVAPPALLHRLVDLRRATDLCGPPLLQRTMAEFLRRDGLKRHLRRVLPVYRERRNTLLAALAMNMPQGVHWTQPQGGFCCWLSLPPQPYFGDLYQAALRQGWAFAPGEVFLAQPSGQQHLRICFGQQPPETIRSGVEALARLIQARMEQATVLPAPAGDVWSPIV
jgi:DNA-binding transcriptional MocR family regulator